MVLDVSRCFPTVFGLFSDDVFWLLKSSSSWTKLSMMGPQLFSGWYQMILDVFQCSQLFYDVFSWVGTFMDNHPMCAYFVELPLWSVEFPAGSGCFCWKSNWTKFDHIGSTGGHWETNSGSFSIPFGNGLEVPSQYPAVSRRRGLGRLQQRSPPTSSNLRREQGGSPLQIN